MQLNLKKVLIVIAAQEDGPGMFPLKPGYWGSTGGRLAIGISIANWTTFRFRSIFRAFAVEPVPLDRIPCQER